MWVVIVIFISPLPLSPAISFVRDMSQGIDCLIYVNMVLKSLLYSILVLCFRPSIVRDMSECAYCVQTPEVARDCEP